MCSYEACTECTQRFLLTQVDSHCMSCRKVWLPRFLVDSFTKTFVFDTLYKHQTDMLLQLEKSLMQSTVEWYEGYRRRKHHRMLQTILNHFNNISHYRIPRQTNTDLLIRDLNRMVYSPIVAKDCTIDVSNLMQKHYEETLAYLNLTNDMDLDSLSIAGEHFKPLDAYLSTYRHVQLNQNELVAPRELISLYNQYVRHIDELLKAYAKATNTKVDTLTINSQRCIAERCPAFLIREDGDKKNLAVCPACTTNQCLDCLLPVGTEEEHKCDPNHVKTMRTITRTSKPCPNCKHRIEKTVGCDQMFCTECNTAFDWKTNEIITGRIHNPHYFEWLQSNRQQQGSEAAPQQPQLQQQGDCCGRNGTQAAWADYSSSVVKLAQLMKQNDVSDKSPEMFFETITRNGEREWLWTVWSEYAKKHLMDLMYLVESVSKRRAIAQFYQFVQHTLGQQQEADERINNNIDAVSNINRPTERYRDLRVMFLQGKINEAGWRSRLLSVRRSVETKLSERQLYDAISLITENIIQYLTLHIKDHTKELSNDILLTLMKSNVDDTAVAVHACFKKQLEVYNQAYDQVIEACRYFNQSMRRLHEENAATSYSFICLPSPLNIKMERYTMAQCTDSSFQAYTTQHLGYFHMDTRSLKKQKTSEKQAIDYHLDTHMLFTKHLTAYCEHVKKYLPNIKQVLSSHLLQVDSGGDGDDGTSINTQLIETINELQGDNKLQQLFALDVNPLIRKLQTSGKNDDVLKNYVKTIYARVEDITKKVCQDMFPKLRDRVWDEHWEDFVNKDREVPMHVANVSLFKLNWIVCFKRLALGDTSVTLFETTWSQDKIDMQRFFHITKTSMTFNDDVKEAIVKHHNIPEKNVAKTISMLKQRARVESLLKSDKGSCFFQADRTLVPMASRSFGDDMVVEVPELMSFLLSTDDHWAIDGHNLVTGLSKLLTWLFQPQFFVSYINGVQCKPEEAMMVPFLLSTTTPSKDDITKLAKRLQYYTMSLSKHRFNAFGHMMGCTGQQDHKLMKSHHYVSVRVKDAMAAVYKQLSTDTGVFEEYV
jgi:hypothetical protein